MDCYPLYITLISANGLKNVNSISKMDVYVIVSIDGYPNTGLKSSVHKDAGSNPRWKENKFRFNLDNLTIKHRSLLFNLKSNRVLGDINIGVVKIPISELFDKFIVATTKADSKDAGGGDSKMLAEERVVEYEVRTTSDKVKGCLKFAYKFGEKYTKRQFSPPPPDAAKVPSNLDKRVMSYRGGPSTPSIKEKERWRL